MGAVVCAGVLHHFHGDLHRLGACHALNDGVAHLTGGDDAVLADGGHGGVVAAPLDGGGAVLILLLHLHGGVDGVTLAGGDGDLLLADPDGSHTHGGFHGGNGLGGHGLPIDGGHDGGIGAVAADGDHIVIPAAPLHLGAFA